MKKRQSLRDSGIPEFVPERSKNYPLKTHTAGSGIYSYLSRRKTGEAEKNMINPVCDQP